VKAHGTGNDFVLLPDPDGRVTLDEPLVRALCDRHLGVGGDGVIRVAPARDGVDADVFMDYWNADGSVAEMCGNGVRCVAKYVADRGGPVDVVRVDTRGGVKTVQIVERHPDKTVAAVRVDMGQPEPGGTVDVDLSPLRVAGSPWAGDRDGGMVTAEQRVVAFQTVSMGNPHAVTLVHDVARAPVRTWGPVVEHDEAFPEGTNVEFIAVPSRDRVVGRIWERGVGETMASGTGASAMAVAAHLLGEADRRVTVQLPGGELEVDWGEQTLHVTGPAMEVASGELDAAWLEGVRGGR
jgi:diaminopimelate epimerase